MFDTLPMDGPEIAPASGGKAKQIVMFLHGVGADGHDLIGLAQNFRHTLPDAYFISPNAPFYCDMAPMGRQWFSLMQRSTPHLLTGIESARPLLNQFIDKTLAAHQLTLDKLIVIGFSQGTMMALHTLLRRETACAAIIGFSGALISSSTFISSITAKPPVCLIHGEEDQIVPFAALPDAEAALQKAGVEVEAHPQPGLGHYINEEGLAAANRFLMRVTAKQPA